MASKPSEIAAGQIARREQRDIAAQLAERLWNLVSGAHDVPDAPGENPDGSTHQFRHRRREDHLRRKVGIGDHAHT